MSIYAEIIFVDFQRHILCGQCFNTPATHVYGSMWGMKQQLLWDRIEAELKFARGEQAKGKEGRARVCARRAAGWAVAAYWKQHLGDEPHPNAYHLLCWFQKLEDVPQDLRLAAARLTTRVTPNHELPHDDDPLEDAQAIVHSLMKEVG